MIGNGGVFVRCRVEPDLMTTGGLPVKLKAQFFQFLNNLPVLETCRVPCDCISKRSYPLFRTRQILNDWLTQNLEEA